MVLLTGFMDLGRIYFCSHSNWRKTNWIWFLFQHYIAFFLAIKFWIPFCDPCLLSYLFCPSTASFILPTGAWEKVELPSELRGAKSTPGGKQGGGWEEQRDCVTTLQSVWDGDGRRGHWFRSQSLEGHCWFVLNKRAWQHWRETGLIWQCCCAVCQWTWN